MGQSHYVRTDKIDRGAMICIYFLDALIAAVYLALIFTALKGTPVVFLAIFCAFCTSKLVLNFLFIMGAIKNVGRFNRLHLFLIWGILEISIVLVNVFYYALGFGNFLSDGYVLIIFDIVMFVIYSRRYVYLNMVKKDFIREAQND